MRCHVDYAIRAMVGACPKPDLADVMRRPATALSQPALTTLDERPKYFASAFTAGAVGCSMVRYTSAFAQCADARDTRNVTYTVRLHLPSSAHATHSVQTGMRGLLVVGT